MMDDATRTLKYWMGLMSRTGLAGLALLAMTMGTLVSVVLPGQRHQSQLEERVEQLKTAPITTNTPAPPPETQLAGFYRAFPKGGTTPDWLQKIYDAASSHGLSLDQGEYILLSDGAAKLDQYRIVFPVKGTYPQLRSFSDEVLRAVPAIALEAVSFKREKVADGSVEARLTFLLYLERGQ